MGNEEGSRTKIVRVSFPAELGFLPMLNVLVEEALRLAEADEDGANAFANAVMEAGTNAAEVGPAGSDVEVELRVRRLEMEVRVSDRGPGLDPDRISGPDDAEVSMALRGRGILIMRAFADEARFEPRPGGGTTVVLRKTFGTRP